MRIGGKEDTGLKPTTHAELPHYSSANKPCAQSGVEIIALGASTGGTDALETVVTGLPEDCPPVLITQHMPPVFTRMYSERLNKSAALAVFEAKDGMRLKRGMCVKERGCP